MSKILIIAEHDGKKLNASTSKCLSCAAQIPGASVDIAVLAADGAAVAAEAAALQGVGKVLLVEKPANAEPVAAVQAPQLAKLAADYDYLLGPSTTFGRAHPKQNGAPGKPRRPLSHSRHAGRRLFQCADLLQQRQGALQIAQVAEIDFW